MKLESFLPYRLNRAAATASRQFSAVYRNEFNLTVPEWRTLATLSQFGTATSTEIGEHSAMHKTKVSRAVASLQRRRWLLRDTDERDRRIEHLSLSPAGHNAYRKLAPKLLAFEKHLLQQLSPTDREALAKSLHALERALGIGRGSSPLAQRADAGAGSGSDQREDGRRRVA